MNEGTATAKDIAVIGAGVVGVCCALALLRDGHRVTLIDRQGPGEGASYGNGAVLPTESVVPVATPGIDVRSAKSSRGLGWPRISVGSETLKISQRPWL